MDMHEVVVSRFNENEAIPIADDTFPFATEAAAFAIAKIQIDAQDVLQGDSLFAVIGTSILSCSGAAECKIACGDRKYEVDILMRKG